jgi:hypothetical protein
MANSISGNAGLANALVFYQGAASGSVYADTSGNYTISGLSNGTYYIYPTTAGYWFNNANSSQTISGSNITGVNFTANAAAGLLASDNFQSGSLDPSWGTFPTLTKCQVVSHLSEATATNTTCGQLWSAFNWPNDQTSEITLQTLNSTGTNTINLTVRYQDPGSGLQGYEAVLSNVAGTTNLKVYVASAGTATQLGSTVTNLTFAAGDVWSIQAAGACISVYQNNLRIFYIGNATIASGGSPGFAQTATTGIANNQISSWRGRSAVFTDGIWQKQGVIVAATASQLTGTPVVGTGISGPEGIHFEGNPQILSGTVYKGYFSDPTGLLYAESYDCLNWHFYGSNPVIANYAAIDVYKQGSTYYLWAQTFAGVGSGSAFMFTSSDGVTWSAAQATNLAAGAGGQWDNPSVYFGLHIADYISGTFYGLYSALNGAGSLASTGLATSTDGLTWTKSGSNPVLVGAFCASQIVKVGSTYYAWMTQNQSGQNNPTTPNFDPSETVRYQSTNLINWTNPTHSLHCTDMWGSLNAKSGQTYAFSVIQIGNRVGIFYNGSPGDSNGNQVYQPGLALAPIGSTIASVVAGGEDGTVQVASDNFTSGTGNLSSNWTTQTGVTKLQIVAGPYTEPFTNATSCSMLYTGASFKQEQYSEVTLHTLSESVDNSYAFPIILGSTAAQTGYYAFITGPAGSLQNSGLHSYIVRKNANVNTRLSPQFTFTPSVGDIFRIAVRIGSDGNNILSFYQNGFLIMQCEDFGTNLVSGSPGIFQLTSTAIANSQISLWAGGNVASSVSGQVGAFLVGP